MTAFLQATWKATAAGIGAGALAFQSGQNLSLSIAAGVAMFAVVWAVPNK